MKTYASALLVLGCILVLAAPSAAAVLPRSYVSVNGNDANACGNPATPCRTFPGAIAQTTAGGEVIVMDSGTFGGGTISQAVTINTPSGVTAVVATYFRVAVGPSEVVTLRGITFVAPAPLWGSAVMFEHGAGLNIDNCVFHGWQTAIEFTSAGKLNVTDSTIRDTSGGITLSAGSGGVRASLERVRLLGNGMGLYVGPRAKATISNSLVTGNGNALFSQADGATSELLVESVVLAHNGYAVFAGGAGSVVYVSNSTITDNMYGLAQDGAGLVLSRGNNTLALNNEGDTYGTIGSYAGK